MTLRPYQERFISNISDKLRTHRKVVAQLATGGGKTVCFSAICDRFCAKSSQVILILVHREEYVQPWVYLKSFHRLWDNIELLRSSLFYEISGCRSFVSPKYLKQDLVIGQNEIVVNSVINRLSMQLWENLNAMFNYFDPSCSNKTTRQISSSSILNPIRVVANVFPGSTVIDYVATATYPMDKPVDVMFTHSLGTSSVPLVVSPTITIPQNKLTGNALLTSSQMYSTLTQTCSFTNSTATLSRGKSTKYKFVVDCSCSFT